MRARSLVVALALAATACGGAEPESQGGAAAGGGAFPRTVTHAMGTAELPERPLRVVALDMTFVDATLALEGEVVGFTTLAGGDDRLPDYFGGDVAKYAPKAVPVGTLSEPNLEKIVELDPDLILSAKVRHEKLYEQLTAIAPTVFSETTGGTWKANLELVGRALGKEDLAKQKIAAYETRAKAVGDAVRAAEGANPTVSVVRFVDGPTRIYKDDTYIGVIIGDLGFDKPEAATGTGFNTEISDEQIGLMDADDIFVSVYADEAGLSAQTKEKFEANPLWGQLKGTVHEVSDKTWMSAVGLYGANVVLDDIAKVYGVDPAR
ncbi:MULTISPECIES: ABC transporter substrate-binding protein [Actinokineospora]|uniref:Siderophore-binding lipoprotein YfiY n=1 Tax=Actinokineospora fastidiosa TaxID=1816 RepID=A0A918GND5_9PSEU|nr:MULTISPECIES: iron-siderophore ABC transporter substrate-binding protein [Actinokineospora]UVS78225.1 putative siderophore-binding lipoprotein YfiY precursor [Actinokineospora sp. UTMC 2448]GGS48749.1 putative siderophore-binding lipoprotein YfiY [Actinokineospora fastidiosa]